MDVAARPATNPDLSALSMLADAFRIEQREARGGVLWDEREAQEHGDAPLEASMADPDALCVVGTINEVVLAFAVVGLERIRSGATIGRIEQLFVDPQARAVGVGEAMMEHVVEWCHSKACIGIDAYALPGERLTKNFFESNGFVARLLTMHHRFDSPS